jgi:hypothetical protein
VPIRKEDDAEVAARTIQIRLTGRKDEQSMPGGAVPLYDDGRVHDGGVS